MYQTNLRRVIKWTKIQTIVHRTKTKIQTITQTKTQTTTQTKIRTTTQTKTLITTQATTITKNKKRGISRFEIPFFVDTKSATT